MSRLAVLADPVTTGCRTMNPRPLGWCGWCRYGTGADGTTCVFDIADDGPAAVQDIAALEGITSETVRATIANALTKLGARLEALNTIHTKRSA